MPNDKTFVVNGCSNHSDKTRQSEDYYATDPKAVEVFLNLPEVFNSLDKDIWEICCGEKHISNVLTARGFNVRNTDIIDRVHDGSIETMDFLTCSEKWGG